MLLKHHSVVFKMAISGIFLAIATLLMFMEFNLPFINFLPPYLKMDFSDIIVAFAVMFTGWTYGLVVAAGKTWIKFAVDAGSGGLPGHVLDTILSIILVYAIALMFLIAEMIYTSKKKHNKYFLGVCIAIYLIITSVVLAFIAVICDNYFLLSWYGMGGIYNFLEVLKIFGTFTLIKYLILFVLFGLIIANSWKQILSVIGQFPAKSIQPVIPEVKQNVRINPFTKKEEKLPNKPFPIDEEESSKEVTKPPTKNIFED
ncbi:MAG: ECF transporter S component [Mycoplasma sp.]